MKRAGREQECRPFSTDPNVAYTWGYGLSGSAATYARLEKITLPGGRQVYYNYEDANAFMSLGRVANIAANDSPDDANTYAAYKYLGASTVVDANHPAVPNGLKLTYGAGHYGGFDRFGRVVWQSWLRTDASAADRYFYGYDRSGNRKWRAERSNAADATGKRDEAYVYDGLDRLVGAKRGILPSGAYQAPYPGDASMDGFVDGTDAALIYGNWDPSGQYAHDWAHADFNGDGKVDGIDRAIIDINWNPVGVAEDLARQWSWSLSPTGNWETSAIDGNSQTRTHDNANQILTISGVTYAPLYDEAGNNVRGPRPADANANNAAHFRYDAWNRLATVHLDDGNTPGTLDPNDSLLATYRYDGLNRRVKKVTNVDGNSVTDYVYHNTGWQVVEVRRGVNQTPTAAAYKQYAWDLRYIDAPVCRWWDGDRDGQMEPAAGEMQYFTNDGNFNTTALIDANSGQVVERYQYDPYGRVTVLNGAAGAEKDPGVSEWSPDADNKSDWDNDVLFCGYRLDAETGLCEVRERYYDPVTGMWKTRDRIGYREGTSLYEICRSSPLGRTDWLGSTSAPTTTPAVGLSEVYQPAADLAGEYTLRVRSMFAIMAGMGTNAKGGAGLTMRDQTPAWSLFSNHVDIRWESPLTSVDARRGRCFYGYLKGPTYAMRTGMIDVYVPELPDDEYTVYGVMDGRHTTLAYTPEFVRDSLLHEEAHIGLYLYVAKLVDEVFVRRAIKMETQLHVDKPSAEKALKSMHGKLRRYANKFFLTVHGPADAAIEQNTYNRVSIRNDVWLLEASGTPITQIHWKEIAKNEFDKLVDQFQAPPAE